MVYSLSMKKIIIPIFIIILMIGGFFYFKKSPKAEPVPTLSTYRNSFFGVILKYPKNLTVKGSSSNINIHHEVPFEHHDYCDFKGEATTTIKTLTDLNVNIHTTSKSLVETIKAESPYIPEENFLNGNIIPSPGFIDPVDFGNLKGFSIFEGAEGCGHTIYYLTVSSNKTLVITNDLITVFSGSIDTENMAAAMAVPGVINKEEAEKIFDSLIKNMVVQ